MWESAIKIIHKSFPQSNSIIPTYRDLSTDRIYELAKTKNPGFVRREIVESGAASLVESEFSGFLKKMDQRALIIPDVGDFSTQPIIGHSERLIERLDEGLDIVISGVKCKSDFVSGYDLFICLERSPVFIFVDHDDMYFTIRGCA